MSESINKNNIFWFCKSSEDSDNSSASSSRSETYHRVDEREGRDKRRHHDTRVRQEAQNVSVQYWPTVSGLIEFQAQTAQALVQTSAYQDQNEDLKYATDISGSWELVYIDSGGQVGYAPAIAVDPLGTVSIAYEDRENGTVKLVSN